MALVDTSVWVDYLRDRRTVAAKALAALIEQGAELATSEPVIMELLAGGDTPMRAEALERLANGLLLLGIDPRLDSEPQPRCTPQLVVKVNISPLRIHTRNR